jgi:exosome complex RNA-binding protein Rrp42 (RNase PH superfamily)
VNKITKLWLLYSGVGLALSLAIISLFDVFTGIRFISNEGIIFGVMFAAMGAALKSYSGQKVSSKSD